MSLASVNKNSWRKFQDVIKKSCEDKGGRVGGDEKKKVTPEEFLAGLDLTRFTREQVKSNFPVAFEREEVFRASLRSHILIATLKENRVEQPTCDKNLTSI